MKYKVTYCFQIMYIKALLFDAFKFDASNWEIDFTLQVKSLISLIFKVSTIK